MKILIYNPYSLDNNSLPVMLDSATEYLQDPENEVLFLTCGGELVICDSNYEGSKLRCAECILSKKLLLKKIDNKRFKSIELGQYLNSGVIENLKALSFNYQTIDEIKNTSYKSINIGLGVISSYVSMTRNLDPQLSGELRVFLNRMLVSSATLVEGVSAIVEDYSPKVMCVFNGRYAGLRPFFEIGLATQTKIEVLECTFSSDRNVQRKVRFINSLPHDIDNNNLLIEDNWKKISGDDGKVKEAALFFEKRRRSEPASDQVYTSGQCIDRLPEDWDSNKRNFVIFNSSEDEFFCVGDSFDKYKLFKDQIDGVVWLLECAKANPGIHYYLRIHPNLRGIKFKYHTGIRNLLAGYKNVTVIDADSPVSTYALIDNCEKIFVFGSTVGVEAAYWGKPVVLLGGAFYVHLNVVYYPQSLAELGGLVVDVLEPKSNLGALKYAAFIFGERGDRPKYFNFDYSTFSIAGKSLMVPRSYEYRGSLIPYVIFVTSVFRVLNMFSHLVFKKITMPRLQIEASDSVVNSGAKG